MIVDDEADVREGIVNHIAWDSLGFEIIAEAENGQDALEKADALDVDVVLTDIKMPFMDGLSMGARLAQQHPSVRLIFLTGFNEFDYAKEAIKLNAVEYILKPVNVAELTEILTRVKASLDKDIEQKRNIEALMESYRKTLPLMRERFLYELLWGTVPEDQIAEQLERYDFPIGKAPYLVATVFMAEPKGKKQPDVAPELVPLSIKQMIGESLAERCKFTVFFDTSAIIAITAWDDKNPMRELLPLVNEVCSRCARVLDITLTAGIGRCCDSVMRVHESFLEAKTALEYKAVVGPGRAVYIEDMERAPEAQSLFDSRSEQQLVSTVRFGTPEQIRRLVNDILDRAEGRSEWGRQTYMLGVIHAVCRIIERYNLSTVPPIAQSMERLAAMAYTLAERETVSEWLCGICACMGEYISAQRVTASKNLVAEARRFIDEHYGETNLSVERVCEHLHVSQSYFSTIFKQETGMSYVQYLTEVRMGHALTLLQETDDKTYVIANKVGYEELNYFSYVFKKRFGVSPSKYRK